MHHTNVAAGGSDGAWWFALTDEKNSKLRFSNASEDPRR
jgi:hypothetical protein